MDPNQNYPIVRPPFAQEPGHAVYPPGYPPPVGRLSAPWNWEQAVRILRKNSRFTVLFAVMMTSLVALAAFRTPDLYQPVARLEIDSPGSGVLSPQDQDKSADSDQSYLETQVQILQSDALGTRVIRALRLDQDPEVVGPNNLVRLGGGTVLAKIENTAGPPAPFQEQLQATERTPLETIALAVFHRQLNVNPVRNSRLVEVSFSSHAPRLSQQITNNLVTQFIEQNYQTRHESIAQASTWLSDQLNDLREKVEQSNEAVVNYQKLYGLVDTDDKDGPTTQLVTELSHQLVEAQADRIQTEAYVRMIDAGEAAFLPQVRDNPTYQALAQRYMDSSAQLAKAGAVYGDQNTNYKKLENEVNAIAAQRDGEQLRVVQQVLTANAAASARERLMSDSMNHAKQQMGDINERMVRYRVLKHEAQANTDLYNTLLGRLKEAGIYAGLKSSNIRVVDFAPALNSPTGPHRPLMIGIGAIFSGIASILLAFVRESFDNTVRTPDDIQDWTGLPSLAMIPPIDRNGNGNGVLPGWKYPKLALLLFKRPNGLHKGAPTVLSTIAHTAEAESMRGLRTSIMLSKPGRPPQVILVASSSSGEGKSTVAINLAATFAQRGKTCLIDGDMRKPSLGRALGLTKKVGLSNVLAGSNSAEDALAPCGAFANLSVLTVGPVPPNPADLIASESMRELLRDLRGRFDHIVIDSPPAIPFSDARVISSLVDGVILVGRYGLTTRRSITRCAQVLEEVRAPMIGVVVNGMDFASADYDYYNYGYGSRTKNNGYYGYEKN